VRLKAGAAARPRRRRRGRQVPRPGRGRSPEDACHAELCLKLLLTETTAAASRSENTFYTFAPPEVVPSARATLRMRRQSLKSKSELAPKVHKLSRRSRKAELRHDPLCGQRPIDHPIKIRRTLFRSEFLQRPIWEFAMLRNVADSNVWRKH
jgi:hypothetical protein